MATRRRKVVAPSTSLETEDGDKNNEEVTSLLDRNSPNKRAIISEENVVLQQSNAVSTATSENDDIKICKSIESCDSTSEEDKVNGEKDDDLSLIDLLPAVLVSSFVSIGSYYSCGSIDLAEDIIVATVRTFVQLSLLAAFLSPLFRFVDRTAKTYSPSSTSSKKVFDFKEQMQMVISRYSGPLLVLAYITCFMLPLAAYEASSRTKLTLRPSTAHPTQSSYPLVFLIVVSSLFIGVFTMGVIAIFFIVKPTPRYSPRHLIPLCGMLFNNALSSISLALDIVFTELQSKQRDNMELMISFGADTWTATRPSFRMALASALKPQINSMNVIGLVAIPGMMTGQVLGGASPVRAARYQIVIMCLILGAGFVAVGTTVELIIWNVFDDRGVLRDGWIVENDCLRVSQLFSSLSLSAPLAKKQGGTFIEENLLENMDIMGNSENSVVAVQLHTKNQPMMRQSFDRTPFLDVCLHGEYANGKRIMTANFTIPTNRDIGIVQGSSGVGKSTLLKTIAELSSGFEPSHPSSTETNLQISLDGKDRKLFQPSEWRRRILYVPQHSASTLNGTPESFLEFIDLHQHKPNFQTLESLVYETKTHMTAWGIETPQTFLKRPWSKLSGGESQRVILAIALATRPQVLLLDEPTSALDNDTKMNVEETLRRTAQGGCAMLIVTHDNEQAKRMGTIMFQFDVV